ncbi:hypothetical protein BYT27DRAFT_6337883 [Phlegmacium glaucopus]|nr:hypothetical protein BYT27DRAFT_6337883 [Phlegmacium glaucopus]
MPSRKQTTIDGDKCYELFTFSFLSQLHRYIPYTHVSTHSFSLFHNHAHDSLYESLLFLPMTQHLHVDNSPPLCDSFPYYKSHTYYLYIP